MTFSTHLRLALLAALACTAQPCAWEKFPWSPPPPESLPPTDCIGIYGPHGTGLGWEGATECGVEGRCMTIPPEAVPSVVAYVDTSIDRWEAIAMPRVVGTDCRVKQCSELLRALVAEQDEGGFE